MWLLINNSIVLLHVALARQLALLEYCQRIHDAATIVDQPTNLHSYYMVMIWFLS